MLERRISLKTCIANAVFILSLFSAHLNVVVTCSQLPMVPSSTQGRIFEKPLGDEMVLGSGELAPKLYHMLKNRVPRLLLSTDERDRKLQFQDLEDILDEIVLTLPSFEFSAGRLFFNDVDVTVQAVVCNNFAISNIIIGHERKNDQEVSLDFEIDGLGFYCSFQYEYDWVTDGSGSASLTTLDNEIQLEFTFISDDFNSSPPNSVEKTFCNATVDIEDLSAEGGLESTIFNFVEGFLRSGIENSVKTLLCDEIDGLIVPLEGLLASLDEILEPFGGDISPELEDPLYPENNLVVPDGVELINFGADDGFIRKVFDEINNMLGKPIASEESDLAINEFLRTLILDENGALAFDGSFFGPQNGTVYSGDDSDSNFSIQSIKIYGIDTLSEFKPIDIVGNYTFTSNFFWESLTIEIDLETKMSPSNAESALILPTTVQQTQVRIGIEDLDIDFAVMIAISEGNLTDIPFGSLTSLSRILACLADNSIHDIEISDMSVTFGNIIPLTIDDGSDSTGLDNLLNSISRALFEMFEGAIINLMPKIFQEALRGALNDVIDDSINGTSTSCAFESNSEFMNLPDFFLPPDEAVKSGGTGASQYGNLFQLIFNTLTDFLTQTNDQGELVINEIFMRPLTFDQSGINGTWVFGDLIDVDTVFSIGSFNAKIMLKIYDTKVEKADSLGTPFELLTPTQSEVLSNAIAIGVGDPFEFKTNIMFSIDSGIETFNLYNDFEFSVIFDNLEINLDIFATIIEEITMNMPLRDLSNMNCLMSLIPAPNLDSSGLRVDEGASIFLDVFSLVASKIVLDAECIDCRNPGIELLILAIAASGLLFDFSEPVNDLMGSLSNSVASGSLQVEIDRYLFNAPRQCPSNPNYSAAYQAPSFEPSSNNSSLVPPAGTFIRNFAILVGGLLFAAAAIIAWIRHGKKQVLAQSTDKLSSGERSVLKNELRSVRSRERKLNAATSSMLTSPSIPLFVRFFVPIVIIGNIAMFVSGHLSLGARVDAYINFAGSNLSIDKVFDFTLLGTIGDMWSNDARELAVFLALFSGIWPYLKQLCTMFLWIAPTKWVSVSKRETMLIRLDILGKWSFVDIFTLIMSLVGFRIMVKSPSGGIFEFVDLLEFDGGLYSLDLVVIPCWGLYANMIAQIISQISSHFVIYYHRKIVSDCIKDGEVELSREGEKGNSALCGHSFDIIGSKRSTFRKGVNVGVLGVASSILVLYTLAFFYTNFSIEALGILGVLMEVGESAEKAETKYNAISIVTTIVGQAKMTGLTSDLVGLWALCLVFLFTVFCVPLLLIILSIYRWLVPMNKKSRQRNFLIVETLSAWQYSEVFILSIVIAAWQLGPISVNLVNDYCTDVDGFFQTLVSLGAIEAIDGQCFRAQADVSGGLWSMTFGAIVLTAMTHFIQLAAKQQVKEEDDIWFSKNRVLPQNVEEEDDDDKLEESLPLTPTFTDFYRLLLSPPREISEHSSHESSA